MLVDTFDHNNTQDIFLAHNSENGCVYEVEKDRMFSCSKESVDNILEVCQTSSLNTLDKLVSNAAEFEGTDGLICNEKDNRYFLNIRKQMAQTYKFFSNNQWYHH